MGNADNTDDSGESDLHGTALDGDKGKFKKRNSDTVLRVDEEEDTLYDDGLEIDDDSKPQSGVDGKDDNAR